MKYPRQVTDAEYIFALETYVDELRAHMLSWLSDADEGHNNDFHHRCAFYELINKYE